MCAGVECLEEIEAGPGEEGAGLERGTAKMGDWEVAFPCKDVGLEGFDGGGSAKLASNRISERAGQCCQRRGGGRGVGAGWEVGKEAGEQVREAAGGAGECVEFAPGTGDGFLRGRRPGRLGEEGSEEEERVHGESSVAVGVELDVEVGSSEGFVDRGDVGGEGSPAIKE